MTWYEHDELIDQANGNQTQPEFDPAASVFTEVHVGENISIFAAAYAIWKAKFDSEYTS